jgi:hypothetical protein
MALVESFVVHVMTTMIQVGRLAAVLTMVTTMTVTTTMTVVTMMAVMMMAVTMMAAVDHHRTQAPFQSPVD